MNDLSDRPTSEAGPAEGVSAARAVACVAALAFLWIYIQKGMLTSVIAGTTALSSQASFIVIMSAAVVCAVVLGAAPWRVQARLLGGRAVLGWGALGCLAGILIVTILSSCEPSLPAAVLTVACLVGQAASFTACFGAWALLLCDPARGWPTDRVLLMVLAGAALGFLIAPSSLNGSAYLHVLDCAGVGVAALCHAFVAGAPSGAGGEGSQATVPVVSGSAATADAARRARGEAGVLAAAFFMTGLLGHSKYLVEGFDRYDDEDFVSYTLLFIIIFVLMLSIQYLGQREKEDRRWVAALVAAVAVCVAAAYFDILWVYLFRGEYAYDASALCKRVSRIVALLVLLVLVRRAGLNPVGTVCLAFLVPTFLPKLIAMLLADGPVSGGLFDQRSELFLLLLLFIGVSMAALLTLLCMVLLRPGALAGRDGAPGSSGAPVDLRRAVCDGMGAEAMLTERETDVLYLASLGNSSKKMADLLGVSTNTVNTHLGSAYRKLGLHTRQELIDEVAARMAGGAGRR